MSAILLCGCEKSELDKTVFAAKQLCLDWGSLRHEVIAIMGDNEAIDNDTSLIFTDWNGFSVVTYQFTDAFLSSTVALLPETDEDMEVLGNRYLRGYKCLGRYSGTQVYAKESTNTIAIIYPFTKDGVSYTAIGWSILSDR